MPSQALGIPDPTNYGQLEKLQVGQLYDWIRQRHQANRSGLHEDLRIGSPELGMYSWAARKGLPEPGAKHLAVRTSLHSHDYNQFEGKIDSGYGAGTVEKADEGKVLITKIAPDKVHFTLAKRYPERFVLVKPTPSETGIGSKPNNWLLLNTTKTQALPFTKDHYKSIPADEVEDVLKNLEPNSSVQAKIDGSLSLTQLLKDKLELLSYRTSKVTGNPIVRTERAFSTVPDITVPKKYQGSVLTGETYGQKDKQVIPPQALGGILNSSLDKSLTTQQDQGIKLKQMIFDLHQLGKKPVDKHVMPYSQRSQTIKDILSSITGPDSELVKSRLHQPYEAHTPEDALKLYHDISSGKHLSTEEGLVIHPPTGTPLKSKLFNEADVHILGVLPGAKKWENKGVGAFVYSNDKGGLPHGEVGSGFSDELRKSMYENPHDYIGRVARVRYTKKLPSGALFQPSLIAMHD